MKYNIYESYVPLMEDWKANIDVVRNHVDGFSDLEATQLAILLENTKTELEQAYGRIQYENGMVGINEVTQVSGIRTPDTQLFDIITAVMPNLIANDIVSVQPMDRRTGQIFYLKFKYGDKKGGIAKSANMLTSASGFANNDYSGEAVTGEIVASAGGAQRVQYTLPYLPVIGGTVTLTDGVKSCTDNGSGVFVGDLVAATPTYNSITYPDGKIDLSIATTVADVTAEWHYDLNDPDATVNQVDVTVESVPVIARPRKLKSIYMFDTAYDLKMSFGLDMDTVIMKATSGEIGFEIDNEIMKDLLAIAASTLTWNINPTYKGMDIKDHKVTFIDAINDASNTILAVTKRYEGCWLVTGKTGAVILEGLGKDHFERANTGSVVGGPHFFGVLEGKYKCYKNPNYADNVVLVGAKGEMFIEAGYVYAPYIPIFATQLLVDENLKGKKGFCTVYAKKVVNANMYCKVTLLNNTPVTPFN